MLPSEKASPAREKARRALNIADETLLLSVATGTLGAAAIYDLTHTLAPRLLDALPNLQIHHEAGVFGSVDVTSDVDASGLAPMSQRSVSESEDDSSRPAATPAREPEQAAAGAATATIGRAGARYKIAKQPAEQIQRGPRRCNADLPRDRYLEVPFFERRDAQLAASDLVVSRASASDCAQLLAAGVPSVLMPAPLAVDSHEYFNAVAMRTAGAAEMAPAAPSSFEDDDEGVDEPVDPEAMRRKREDETEQMLIDILTNVERRATMARAARSDVGDEAARVTAQALIELAQNPKSKDVAALRPYIEQPPASQQRSAQATPTAA